MIPLGLPNQFLNWRFSDGKKVPCLPDGTKVDAHDTSNHVSYETAAASGLGVAFVLTENDPWFFLDLDKCRQPTGEWDPRAVAIWSSFAGAWGEMSQSGTGLHIMGYCDKRQLQDRRHKWDGWLEFYTEGRFIAFGTTGWEPIGGVASGVDWTQQLLRFVPQREFLGDLPDGRDPTYTGPENDDDLIRMMLASKAGGIAAAFGGASLSVKDLWEANPVTIAARFPSFNRDDPFDRSSADAALMTHLAFWTGKDLPRMDRLFRRSGLMREKYERREDYRRDTVQNAARLCKAVYNVPARAPVAALPSEVYLTVPEMIEHFKDCVYVLDIHRVLMPDGSLLKPEQFKVAKGGHMFQMMPDNTKPTDDAFKVFTECRVHRFDKAKGLTFLPDKPRGYITPGGLVNVYAPADVPCRPGDVSRFLEYMSRLLPDERDRRIVLSYCAAIVQYPGRKFQWSIVLQGVEGNGKTLVASCVAEAIGRQYVHEPRSDRLASNFNSYLSNKMMIIVEEFHMKGRRDILDLLKPLITNRYIETEGKGVDAEMTKNVTNWIFNTNYRDAVMKSINDRRYAVFFTAQQELADLTRDGFSGRYFPDLYRWLDAEGYAYVTHFLRTYPIDPEFNPAENCARAPDTSSIGEVLTESRGVFEQEVVEALESGQIGFRGGWVSGWAFGELVGNRPIGRNKWSRILASLGYEQWGRASKPILMEDGQRPYLWIKQGKIGTLDDYLKCQGPSYT